MHNPSPRLRRIFWTAVVVAAFAGSTAATLLTHVDDLRDSALAPEPPGWTPLAVPLESVGVVAGAHVQRLRLYAADPQAVLRRTEIDVLFATWGRTVPLVRGALNVGGCFYATPRGERVKNNALVRFIRTAQCPASEISSDEIMLTMRTPRNQPLAVTAFTPSEPVAGGELIFVGARADGRVVVPVLRGRYVDARLPSRARRIHLLAYVWQIAERPYWIGGVLVLASILFLIGAVVWPRGGYIHDGSVSTVLSASSAAACVALGLGLLYAVLVPPFQAPDEPDHFLAFADLAQRPELAEDAAHWAKLGHLERIKFRNLERFRPIDTTQPYPQAWNADVFALPIAGRSRTTELLWRLIARGTRTLRGPGTLLTIRLTNAVVFAVAAGVGVALLLVSGGTASTVAALLLIPTLPFFATHASEFAALTVTYIVVACAIAALFVDGPRTHWLGLPLGLSCALMLAGGRSSAPMMAVAAAALLGRALLGTASAVPRAQEAAAARRHGVIFWVGASLGASLLIPLSTEEFSRGLWPGDAAQTPGWFRSAAGTARDNSWILPAVLPIGALVELSLAPLRRVARSFGSASRPSLRRLDNATAIIARLSVYGGAAALVMIALASLAVDMPKLRSYSQSHMPPVGQYIADTIAVTATSFRLRGPDYLLSISFWGGFGWLDATLATEVVTMIVAVFGAMMVLLLVRLGSEPDRRRIAWLGLLATGWTVALVLYAISSNYLHRNLHGRYLVGLYLSMLMIIGTAPTLLPVSQPKSDYRQVALQLIGPALLIIAAALHTYALLVVLRRYF